MSSIWWEAAVSSSDVEAARDDLDKLASRLSVMQQGAGRAVGLCRDFRTRITETWGGPRPQRINGRILTYVNEIDEITGVVSGAAFTVTSWYNHAVWKTERLQDLEAAVTSAQYDVDNWSFDSDLTEDEAFNALGSAISLHIESAQNWMDRCKTYGDELDGAIRALKRLNGITAFADGESVPPTGAAFETAMMDIADDLGVSAYAEEPLPVGDIRGASAAGFFIAWLLDPYHDTVVAAIAVEGMASPGLGCKLDNGTFPDLCRPGSVPFQIGEVKYNTAPSIAAGQRQLATYTSSSKSGNAVTRGGFMGPGFRLLTVGGVTVQYGQAVNPRTGAVIDGLYTYQIVGWSIPALLESHAQARAHAYSEVPDPAEVPLDLSDPADSLADTAAQPGSSADGGWNPPAIPRIELSPQTAVTAGVVGAIVLAGVLILAL